MLQLGFVPRNSPQQPISSILVEIPFLRRKPELLIDPCFLCYNKSSISPLRGVTQVSSLGVLNSPLSQTSGCILVWGISRESCIHVAKCLGIVPGFRDTQVNKILGDFDMKSGDIKCLAFTEDCDLGRMWEGAWLDTGEQQRNFTVIQSGDDVAIIVCWAHNWREGNEPYMGKIEVVGSKVLHDPHLCELQLPCLQNSKSQDYKFWRSSTYNYQFLRNLSQDTKEERVNLRYKILHCTWGS